MDRTIAIDLDAVAQCLKLPAVGVKQVAELLDEGNTVPFITRYRKDQTGGLDEQQIRDIQQEVKRQKLLIERKETILKSIESRDQLTPQLTEQIEQAKTLRYLEDIYLPYKPKKQTLASLARSRGLEPLMRVMLSNDDGALTPEQHAEKFVDAKKGLASVGDVLQSVGHLIAEYYGENAQVREFLRQHLWREGRLVSKRVEESDAEKNEIAEESVSRDSDKTKQSAGDTAATPPQAVESVDASVPASSKADDSGEPSTEADDDQTVTIATDQSAAISDTPATETLNAAPQSPDDTPASPIADAVEKNVPSEEPTAASAKKPSQQNKASRRDERREARRRRRQRLVQSFEDYFDYSEPLSRVPPHRILAINRGDRTKVLRIKVEVQNASQLFSEVEKLIIPQGHVYGEFLRGCLQDAMSRLIMPSLEREVRRELTERSEGHAVDVFARNLRKLLLQPPLRGHRVLAIDPGFRSGCKLVALDEFGHVLGHQFIHLVGNEERRKASRNDLVEFVGLHSATVIAIGNGTACRQTEILVADVLTNELSTANVSYLIVNEAGASVYSTSQISREELPEYDATVRSAVSIGRRTLDPLSELVKIDPANIGVGLYQHDVKAKHLRESLDAVVESCVNFVGVDVNSASPALLRYVSGLNALTARRIFEYRREHGPFRTRQQLEQVPGIGESTFVQAAGFLKITRGENPLDGTWIHPESYDVAQRVLEATGCAVKDLECSATVTNGIAANQNLPDADTTGTDDQAELTEPVAQEPASAAESPAEVSDSTDSTPVISAVAESHEPDSQNAANGTTRADPSDARNRLVQRLADLDVEALSRELNVGRLLLQDILSALARPGRDPREDLPPPVFRRGILKLEDLRPGMELSGTVLNVVDFGVFVDIGLVDSGLIHISRLANRFVADPHDVVSVGDILHVWVVEVDQQRRRVSLTAIEPGTERSRPEKRKRPAATQQPRQTAKSKKPRHPSRAKDGGRRRQPARPRPKAKPKPVVPITDAMQEGLEPMRTFSDLKQFFEKQKPGDSGTKEAEGDK